MRVACRRLVHAQRDVTPTSFLVHQRNTPTQVATLHPSLPREPQRTCVYFIYSRWKTLLIVMRRTIVRIYNAAWYIFGFFVSSSSDAHLDPKNNKYTPAKYLCTNPTKTQASLSTTDVNNHTQLLHSQMAQLIGYRFNGPNLCRLAKGMLGEDCTRFFAALGLLIEEFEERPDKFRIEAIPAPVNDPLDEDANIIFVIWCSSKREPIPFKKLRRTPRMQEAKDFLRDKGFDEIDEWKLIQTYLD